MLAPPGIASGGVAGADAEDCARKVIICTASNPSVCHLLLPDGKVAHILEMSILGVFGSVPFMIIHNMLNTFN